MSDHLDRVAEVLWERPDCWAMAEALDAAGLLASPERDAEVERLRHELEHLRAGIRELVLKYDDPKEDNMSPDYYGALGIASSDLAELLNPTEGEVP